MGEIELKLKATVSKVVDLHDNEAISFGEAKDYLGQFKKEDLINALLENEDLDDDDDDGENIPEEEPSEPLDTDTEDDSEDTPSLPPEDDLTDLDLDDNLDSIS